MKDLKKVLEENKEEYINNLKDLVAIDTHDLGHGIDGGLEKEGQDFLINFTKNLGYECEIDTDPMKETDIEEFYRKYKEGNLGHNYDDRFNVYIKFKGNQEGKSLMFNSHMDVMPADNVDEWTSPPFSPTIRDGKIYARGTADMKAGLMASILAVDLLKKAGKELPGDIIITSVCDEEGGGNGSMQAISSGQKADGVVVCEGTNRELVLASMGFVFFKFEFEGIGCHSGTKIDGVSAIEKAIKLIAALNEKEHDWLLRYKHPLLPAPNLNVGVIGGGSAGSTVADYCHFESCVHYLPNIMTHDQVVKEVMEVVDRVCLSDEFLEKHRPKVSIYQAGGGFEMDEDHDLVKSFKQAYKDSLDKEIKVVGSPAGCDSRLWRNILNCPTIQFGPGSLAQAHGIDEYVEIDEYLESILVYANLILQFC